MLRFLKLVRYTFWAAFFTILIFLASVISITENNEIPAWSEIYTDEIPSPNYSQQYQSAIVKSRKSSVKVHSLSLSLWGGLSTLT